MHKIAKISALASLLVAAAAPAAAQVNDDALRSYIEVERFEYRAKDGPDAFLWDTQAWYGGDYDKLWLKSEGEGEIDGPLESAEFQALYSRAVTAFFDVQGGIRHDIKPNPDRTHAVLGLQGLAPYFFEVDAAGFLSDEGDLTARIEAEYHLLFTQKLVFEPRLELELAAQDVPELGIGSGISHLETGARLRYEIKPELAPYIGLSWERAFGDTADFARAEGHDASVLSAIAGIRMWF